MSAATHELCLQAKILYSPDREVPTNNPAASAPCLRSVSARGPLRAQPLPVTRPSVTWCRSPQVPSLSARSVPLQAGRATSSSRAIVFLPSGSITPSKFQPASRVSRDQLPNSWSLVEYLYSLNYSSRLFHVAAAVLPSSRLGNTPTPKAKLQPRLQTAGPAASSLFDSTSAERGSA